MKLDLPKLTTLAAAVALPFSDLNKAHAQQDPNPQDPPTPALQAVNFTQVTNSPVATNKGRWFSVGWGDVNGDGNTDLFTGNAWGGKHAFYVNRGAGNFEAVTTGDLVTLPNDASAGIFGDVNNDGKLDLFTVNFASPADDRLYINTGDNENVLFTRIKSGPPVGDSGHGEQAVFLDYDRDGHLDIFVCNENDSNYLYRNTGTGEGKYTRIRTGVLVTDRIDSAGASVTDVNNDGFPDILVGHAHNAANDTIYLNQAGTGFLKAPIGPGLNDRSVTFGTTFADLNNDGNMDIIAGHYDPGPHNVYLGNGDGTFSNVPNNGLEKDKGKRGVPVVGDFNNDGKLDVFFSHSHGNTNTFYLGDGNGVFVQNTTSALTSVGGGKIGSFGAAAADYDNDGWLDLVVGNADQNPDTAGITATCFLFHNEGGNNNGWLEMRLVGSQSNRSAIGARVYLSAVIEGKPVTQIREVQGGTSYLTDPDDKLHFGLGNADKITEARIVWPSGVVQNVDVSEVNRILNFIEPPRLDVTDNGSAKIIGARDYDHVVQRSRDLKGWQDVAVLKGGSTFNLNTDQEGPGFYRVSVVAK